MNIINNNSLIIVIDITTTNDRMLRKDNIIKKQFTNFDSYQKKILNNIKNLCLYCNKNNIDIVNADYISSYCGNLPNYKIPELKDIQFKYTINKHEDIINIEKYDSIYFCGKSFDQCVMRRLYGYTGFHPCDKTPYSPFLNKKKYIILDCCILGIPVKPIDHCIQKSPFKEDANIIPKNEEEEKKYKLNFCKINSIEFI